jgi:hypothetical protein
VQWHLEALAVIFRSAWLISRACAPTVNVQRNTLSTKGASCATLHVVCLMSVSNNFPQQRPSYC